MTVSQDELQKALYLVPYDELRNRIYNRDLTVDGQTKDDYIDCLLQDTWTEDEFNALMEWIRERKEESDPVGNFVCNITGISTLTDNLHSDEFKKILLQNPAEFRSEDQLESEGYEIVDHTETTLEATYWTQSKNHKLDPAGNIRTVTTLYATGFKIDFEEQILLISSDNFGKTQGLMNELEAKGLALEEVGHQHLVNEAANNRMQEFVDDLEEALAEAAKDVGQGQHSLGDFN